MPAEKPKPSSADWVTIALSPPLIMAMIVSLVFFVLAIFYHGEFTHRLHVILFFFIFGIVLVARIALETGFEERAPLYGSVLALLTWFGMGSLVTYPPELAAPSWLINAGLVALAWWLSYRLVYSCTYIDEKADNTGTGMLQAAGLDAPSDAVAEPAKPDTIAEEEAPKRGKKPAAQPSWWQRYQRYSAERRQTQPPGLWVVYFGLAALPIFGLGQALIDVSDVERRDRTVFYMTVYIISSLGLLVTTAFLGLRRYLRQRRLEMPVTVTTAWVSLGVVLVACLTAIGALLPRPQAQPAPPDWARATSAKRDASRFAQTRGEPGKGQGKSGAEKPDADGKSTRGKGSHAKGGGDKGEAKGGGDGPKKNTRSDGAEKSKDAGGDSNPAANDAAPPAAPALAALSRVLKWLVFGILALVTLFILARRGLRYLANFCDWARRLLDTLSRMWEDLFGRRRSEAPVTETEIKALPPPPFRSFANPFDTGGADRMKPTDLVRYSFAALESWAGERASGRAGQETPIEFTDRLASEVGSLDRETQQLGDLYARVLYAEGSLPPSWRGTLEVFWRQLGSGGR